MSEALNLIKMEFGGQTPSEIIVNYFSNIEKSEGHPLSQIINDDQTCLCGKESSVYVCAIGVDKSYQNYIPVKVPPSLRNVYVKPMRDGISAENVLCHECLETKDCLILNQSELESGNSDVIFKYDHLPDEYTDLVKSDDFFLMEKSTVDMTFKNIHIFTRQELDPLWSDLPYSDPKILLERIKVWRERSDNHLAGRSKNWRKEQGLDLTPGERQQVYSVEGIEEIGIEEIKKRGDEGIFRLEVHSDNISDLRELAEGGMIEKDEYLSLFQRSERFLLPPSTDPNKFRSDFKEFVENVKKCNELHQNGSISLDEFKTAKAVLQLMFGLV